MAERFENGSFSGQTQVGTAVVVRGDLGGGVCDAGDTALYDQTHPGVDDIVQGPASASASGAVIDVAAVTAIGVAITADVVAVAGDVIAGAFELQHPIGAGGMGVVWEGRDLTLDRQVAIKLMRIEGQNSRQRQRLLRLLEQEARATARLHHPNVVTIHQVGTWRGSPYLVLELLQGQSLERHLGGGSLPVTEAIGIMVEVLRALVHAHGAGLIHRDLKPQNVFLTDDGLVKVLDFGLAQFDAIATTGQKKTRKSGVIAGSPAYMAPEQWRGQDQDGRTDLWACGVLLFQLVTGQLPFERPGHITDPRLAPLLRSKVADLPEALERVVARCLAKTPAARYGKAADLLHDLCDLQALLGSDNAPLGEPFRYLRPFQADESPWFFGRTRESVEVLHHVLEQPLTALIGASGAGKTSLINAGLLPQLRRAGEAWSVIMLRPGRDPLLALEDRLADSCSERALTMAGGVYLSSPEALGRVLRAHAVETGTRVVLWVDQLEQLLAPDVDVTRRDAFSAALLAVGDAAAAPVRVLLCLREEALPLLAACPRLHDAIVSNAVPLRRPDTAALQRCLTEPMARVGFGLESGLLDQLLAGLQDQAAPLPMLQFAASELWARRDMEMQRLTLAALNDLGGMDGLFAHHAESIFVSFITAAERLSVRQILCALVSADGRRVQQLRPTLERRTTEPDRATHVITRLIEGRILTSSPGRSGQLLELTHGSLITGWQRLKGWLNDDVEVRLFRSRLGEAAATWQAQGRPHGSLWVGDAWRRASRLLPRIHGKLSDVEAAFVQCAETVAARSLWLRRGIWGALILAIIAVAVVSLATMRELHHAATVARRAEVAAVGSARQARQAQAYAQAETALVELERQRGVANVLAASSRAQLRQDPMAALTLARRAAQTSTTAAALSALHGALAGSPERRRYGSGGPPLIGARLRAAGAVLTFDDAGGAKLWRAADAAGRAVTSRDGAVRNGVGRGAAVVASVAQQSSGGLILLRANGALQWLDAAGTEIASRGAGALHGDTAAAVGIAVGIAVDDTGQAIATVDQRGRLQTYATASAPGTPVAPSTPSVLLASTPQQLDLGVGAHAVVWFAAAQAWAIAGDDGRIRLVNRKGQLLGRFPGHKAAILALVASPDGRSLLSGSKDGTARMWRASGRSRVVARHGGWVTTVAVSGLNSVIATGSVDETAALWHADGRRIATLQGHDYGIVRVRFSADGRRLLTASLDGTARIWSAGGALELVLTGHQRPLVDGRWSADGRFVLTASEDGTARRWRTEPEERWTRRGGRCALGDAAMGPAGEYVLTWPSTDGFDPCPASPPRLWSMVNGASVPVTSLGGRVSVAVLDEAGGTVGLDSGQLARFDHNGVVQQRRDAHSGGVVYLLRRPTDGALLTSGMDGQVALWHDLRRPRWRKTHASPHIAFCGRRDVLVADKVLTRYDPLGAVVGRRPVADLTAVACDTQGQQVVYGTATGQVWLMPGNLASALPLRAHHGAVTALHVLDAAIVSASRDGTVRLWSLAGEALANLAHGAPVIGLIGHDAGDRFVSVPASGPLRLWSGSGVLLARLSDDQAVSGVVSVSASASASASASGAGSAQRGGEYGALQMSADGRYLLVARLGEDVRVRWLDGDELLVNAGERISLAP